MQQGLTSNPRLDNNRYGATFGGPIIKNKLFFFTDFERNPLGYVSVGGGTVAAPTAAGLAAIATDPGLSQNNFSIFKQYVPVAAAPSGCITYNGTALSGAEVFSSFSTAANGTCAAGSVEVGNVSIVPHAWQSWTNLCPEHRLQHVGERSVPLSLHLQQRKRTGQFLSAGDFLYRPSDHF